MPAHPTLGLTLAAAVLGTASACADLAGHDPREITASAVPAPTPLEPAPASELPPTTNTSSDAESKPRLSAAAVPTSAHQSTLAVFGQLAATQALIVSLLVAPFATTKTDDPGTARDSPVPR